MITVPFSGCMTNVTFTGLFSDMQSEVQSEVLSDAADEAGRPIDGTLRHDSAKEPLAQALT